LRLEHPAVREALWQRPDSVVRSYLGLVDGWRLDTANDLGPEALADLRASAHDANPDSYIVGELFNYPAGWLEHLDGALNLHLAALLFAYTRQQLPASRMGPLLEDLVVDCGIEKLLRCWNVLANHDKPRLATELPSLDDRRFILTLLVTLPGAPLLYYGEELGLQGGQDPEQRGTMDWPAIAAGRAPELELYRQLLSWRQDTIALQVGDLLPVRAEHLLAFARVTDRVAETVLVVANATDQAREEWLSPRIGWLVDGAELQQVGTRQRLRMQSGMVQVRIPPRTVLAWTLPAESPAGYQYFKHIP
jgi:glycosidase